MIVYVLKKHNGEHAVWHEIDNRQIDEWMKDGSLQAGDMVIEPNVIWVIKEKIVSTTMRAREKKEVS